MPKKKNSGDNGVGRSHRTPLKHSMLDMLLGQVVGIGWTRQTNGFANFSRYPFTCIDLCAGDGLIKDGEHTSSPFIICKHAWHAKHDSRLRHHSQLFSFETDAIFIEQLERRSEVLAQSIDSYEKKGEKITILTMDARDFKFVPMGGTHPIFINADPNSIHELPIAKDFGDQLTPATTYTVTLGCNVGGLKMLSPEKRAVWYEYIEILSSGLPNWHDVILCSIDNDDAQWAYLNRLPSKWSDRLIRTAHKNAERIGEKVSIASMKQSADRFKETLDILFKTKKERGVSR